VPKDIRKLSAEALAAEAAAAQPEFVVITGGEPCIHDLSALIAALNKVKLPAHLETCGAYPIAAGFAWVTVSPKWNKPPIAEARAQGDLSENAEYDAAKDRQGFIEGRIQDINGKLRDGAEKLGLAMEKFNRVAGNTNFAETAKQAESLVSSLERLAELEASGMLDKVMKAMAK
jgi:organic radical activating enzyme